jgi:hypothetical protein
MLMGTFRPSSFVSNVISKAMLLLVFALSGNVVYSQIAQRGSATSNVNSGTNIGTLTIGRPSGVIAGDIIIANIVQNETDNDNGGLSNVTATGWNLVSGGLIRSDGTNDGQNAWWGTVLYRIADGTEANVLTFDLPNSRADMAIGSVVAFSGVTATAGFAADGTAGGPFDVDPGTFNLANLATATATEITTATANAAVVMFAQVNNDRSYSSWASTNPTTLNELYDNLTTSGDDASVGAAWAIRSAAGATGNGTVTISASDRNAALMIALRQAVPAITVSASPISLCGSGTTSLSATIRDNLTSAYIGFQGFESSGSTVTYSSNNGGTQTGTIAAGDGPASAPYFYGGTTGFRANNTTATVTLANVAGLSGYTNKAVSLDLAAFSLGSQGNGVDNGDNVIVAISLDGGTNYSNELRINGNSNAYWGYTTGSGVASVTYDGNNTPTIFAPTAGGNRTTDGYSFLLQRQAETEQQTVTAT